MTQGTPDQSDEDFAELAPKWIRRLGRLADLGSETDPLKVRQRLLENLDRLGDASLLRCRTYATKDGDTYTMPDPDLKTALGCQLAGARMLGVEGAVQIAEKIDATDLDAVLERAKRKLRRDVLDRKKPEPAEEGRSDAPH